MAGVFTQLLCSEDSNYLFPGQLLKHKPNPFYKAILMDDLIESWKS